MKQVIAVYFNPPESLFFWWIFCIFVLTKKNNMLQQTLLSVIKQALIGKSIRICTYCVTLFEEKNTYIKSSVGVTNAQFESGNPKFREKSVEKVKIGRDRIFEDTKIVDVYIESGESYRINSGEIRLILENGEIICMSSSMIESQNIYELSHIL